MCPSYKALVFFTELIEGNNLSCFFAIIAGVFGRFVVVIAATAIADVHSEWEDV